VTTGASTRRIGTANAKVLIADPLNDRGSAILKESGLQIEVRPGLSEAQLCEIIGLFDGLIVRSATTVTPKVIAAAKKLQVIGRAGVGVDNIDLKAATQAGIIVQNTPLGNITSAAEHAIALLFAAARNVAKADKEMKAGKWGKKGLTGVELTGKTLGIVGMGKIGGIVLRVAKALDMTVLVYDPYLTEQRARDLEVTKCDLESFLKQVDFVTIHTPLTEQTRNLLNKDTLKLMKKSARIINDARGGIINEADLCDALKNGVIAGAGLDVFETEPLAADSPLRSLENITLTPHLGASTEEAQERVAEDIAKQFVEFFRDGVIRNAVNLAVQLNPALAPYAKISEMMGSMLAQMSKAPVAKLKVNISGKLASGETREISLCALKGLLARTTTDPITMVNVTSIAEQRGVELIENKSEKSATYTSLIEITAETESGTTSIAGTCFDGQEGRIVRINDYDIADLKPAPIILLMFYPDRPGMIGKIGTILGEADVNIAHMAVGRREKRGQAVVALTIDDQVSPEVLQRIRSAITVDDLFAIHLK
jgi:D-3-phosphoglycerate dehydrogenase / 2-oxoglutarate reductase